jgi:hypothetical protein
MVDLVNWILGIKNFALYWLFVAAFALLNGLAIDLWNSC